MLEIWDVSVKLNFHNPKKSKASPWKVPSYFKSSEESIDTSGSAKIVFAFQAKPVMSLDVSTQRVYRDY